MGFKCHVVNPPVNTEYVQLLQQKQFCQNCLSSLIFFMRLAHDI